MQRVWHLFIRNLGLRATFNVFIPAISLKIIMVHVPIAKPILKPRMLFFFFYKEDEWLKIYMYRVKEMCFYEK